MLWPKIFSFMVMPGHNLFFKLGVLGVRSTNIFTLNDQLFFLNKGLELEFKILSYV